MDPGPALLKNERTKKKTGAHPGSSSKTWRAAWCQRRDQTARAAARSRAGASGAAPPGPAPPPGPAHRPNGRPASPSCPPRWRGRAPAQVTPGRPRLQAGETISYGGGRGGACDLLHRKRTSEKPEVLGILGNSLFIFDGAASVAEFRCSAPVDRMALETVPKDLRHLRACLLCSLVKVCVGPWWLGEWRPS